MHTQPKRCLSVPILLGLVLFLGGNNVFANIAGGGTGSGPDVTVTDNGDDTVTLANGIVSIVIVKDTARLNSLSYTYNNNGTSKTSEILLNHGQYYYGGFMLGSGTYEYSLATDPASNGGNYADVKLLSTSDNKGTMEAHFSMLRGSPGFYSTATQTHRSQDAKCSVGAWGVVTRVTPNFDWVSADAWRNFFIGQPSSKGVKVPNSPHEVTVCLDGARQGEYEDKFIYGQDHCDLRGWGWSSVGSGGLNVGMWMMTNMDFSDGGPLKHDVSVYPYSCLNNSILTGELGMGSDGNLADGEVWTKTCGPWFIYLNNVPASVTGTSEAAHMLFHDALAQADAEKKAWPYSWYKDPNFVPASGRGTVHGKLVINDPGNPNASAAGTWVGLEQQPQTTNGTYDFQKWLKPYQYWVQSDANGNFSIPNVIAGDNYTLWAYGPGAAGTFMSQNQTGGDPPLELDVSSPPASVSVKAGAPTEVGTVTWTPVRVGATVFELGYPNRKAGKFRHGEDFWCPEVSPKLGYPTPVWGGQMQFPIDYPDGMTYSVENGKWARDWNYVLPVLPDAAGIYQASTGKITFNMAQDPANGAAASLYIACAGDDGGDVIVSVNGTNLGTAGGVTAAPDAISEKGFNPAYSDDSSYHFSDHGPFSDERINFPGSLLHAGQNTVTIEMNARGGTAYLMVDYLRLELAGYVPPAPTSVIAYPGNNRNLVRWSLVPGATSYTILRSASATSGFTPVVTGLVGPVCGSGPSLGTYTDTTAANGTSYFYVVQSANPTGHSISSPPSSAAMPAPDAAAAMPSTPVGLNVTRSGHHEVDLSWTASPGANYYSVWRTTLHDDHVGGSYGLRTILLEDTVTGTTYTDHTPTDGDQYSYYVQATNAAGTSSPSADVKAQPLPVAPATAPASLAGQWTRTKNGDAITLKWDPVPGAVGYVIYRIAGDGDTFQWPANFLTSLVETTYTDQGNTEKNAKVKGLNKGATYSYQVTAVNAAGISPPSSVQVAP
jgi:rhamnogalacturonan endolyase